MDTKKTKYECFSSRLTAFLHEKGFVEKYTYVHKVTNVQCHVFDITPELSQALKDWKATNPNKK